MRIGCLQFAPQVGDVENNLNRADAVLSRAADVEELHLLVLPELAFTGYNFKSLEEISPYLEPSGAGITSLWARTMALKYDCTVLAGYPEKVDVTPRWPTSPEYYNSAILVNPDGETIANYRKSFLYYTDESWALEGPGFYSGNIPGLGKTSIGICMDLNPYKFEASWEDYEFAAHALHVKANLVILSMAWMTRDEPREYSRMPNEPDMETLTYWVTRLEPLIKAKDASGEVIVVFANRTGIEGEAIYAGTSAVIGIEDGEVRVYGMLGRGDKELLVVDTTEPPFAKLVYRPQDLDQLPIPDDQVQKSSSDDTEPGHQTADAGSPSNNESPTLCNPDKELNASLRKEMNGEKAPENVIPNGCGRETPLAAQQIAKSTDETTPNRNAADAEHKAETDSGKTSAKASPVAYSPESAECILEGKVHNPVAPITIPENSKYSSSTHEKTLGSDGTPTATDAGLNTPPRMGVRPKIVIPNSPNMAPKQMHSDQPISAASNFSARSSQSIRSNISESSIQTIRSNPRPPEDSTPYPHSGLSYRSHSKRRAIYDGSVTINSADSAVPLTPFEDMSPNSAASWYWPQSANPFSNLKSAGGWRTRTPVGSAPEPFPWPAMRVASRPGSRSSSRMDRHNPAVRQPTPPATSQYKTSKSPEPSMAVNDSNTAPLNHEKPEKNARAVSVRPISPKSRNVSRSRPNEGPELEVEYSDISAAIQHLENVSRRASSVSRTGEKSEKSEQSEPEPYRSTSSWPKARKGDLGINVHPTMNPVLEHEAIPIAASPSLMANESLRKKMVPTPAAVDYYRSASSATMQGAAPLFSGRTTEQTRADSAERSQSRGRQRDPKLLAVDSLPRLERQVRDVSADSTRNDLLHRHVRRSSANGGGHLSRNSSRNTLNSNITLPGGYTAEDFERVEEVARPDCPVHGSRSSSANSAVKNVPNERVCSQNRPRRRRSTSQALGVSFSSPSPEMTEARPRKASPVEKSSTVPRCIPEPRCVPAPGQRPRRATQKAKRSFASSPVPRPSTAPLSFNPPTPKAMAFIPAVGELDSPVEEEFVLPTGLRGKSVEKNDEKGIQLPVTA